MQRNNTIALNLRKNAFSRKKFTLREIFINYLIFLRQAPVTVDLTFSKFLKLYQKRYVALSKKRDNMSEQRNKIYAHNDVKRIFNPEEVWICKN